MLLATFLALGAAVMHAGWNLAVKQSGDRFIALWGQFFMAGLMAAAWLAVVHGVPLAGWGWATLTGLAHVPYCIFLARAYTVGDFSLAYPIARGGGAVLAGIGGLLLLDDHLSALGIAGMVVVAAGLIGLTGRGAKGVGYALVVALAIGTYSVIDAHAVRSTHSPMYAAAPFVTVAITVSVVGLVTHRGGEMVAALHTSWRRFLVVGFVVGMAYVLVQIAFKYAAVGYVTCLRETSVVIAALVGHRVLREHAGRRRITAAGVVVVGLLLLVIGR